MKRLFIAAACASLLCGPAFAQSSQGKGGAATTSETADPTKAPGGMSTDNRPMGTGGMTSGSSMPNTGAGGANKNGDGQMSKGGMAK